MNGCCEEKEKGMPMMGGNMEDMCMEMCKKMMESVSRSCELAAYATPEVRGLFEDWTEEVSSEILQFIKKIGRTRPEEIAKEVKISLNSVIFFISHLARQGKLKIESVVTTKENER